MEKVRFAPKDAKIIKENPGKTPYEWKALGMSEKGFEKALAQATTDIEPVSDPELEAQEPEKESDLQAEDLDLDEDESEEEDLDDNDDENIRPASKQETSKNKTAIKATAITPANNNQPNKPQKLIPKLTGSVDNTAIKAGHKLHANQVLVRAPNGRINPMGKAFALKLVQNNSGYSIIE